MANKPVTPGVRFPILAIIVGRQRVGKTTIINTIIQKIRENGGDVKIWNADEKGPIHNLGVFHSDALAAPTSTLERLRRGLRHWSST